MFKVSENGDGSTTIFCNKTGKLICTIRGQRCNMGLGGRPVNVVEPSPKPRSYCYNLDLKSEGLSDDDEKQDSRKICTSPPLEDCLENYTHDCITQEDFARCLNLIPRKKLETESIDQLKSTFPLRLLSRTRAFVVNDDFRDVKLPDDLPITSSLGVKILKFNKQKNFYCDQTIEMKIKNYDSFCRFQLNSVCSNFPKLRCREKKEYPICIPQKILKYGHTHMYAFNKRQRKENLITFKTGLTTRSRKLLLKCNKRLAVNIERLSPEEISTWLQKRSRPVRPVLFNSIREELSLLGSDSDATVIEQSSPFYIDVESISSSSSSSSSSPSSSSVSSGTSFVMYPMNKEIVSFSGILRGTDRYSSSPKSRNRHNPKLIRSGFPKYDCFVKVGNVLNGIHKYYGDYYVRGTNIRVPFFSDFLNSLSRKKLGPICIPEANGMASSRSDHAYHLPFSFARKKIIQNSQSLNHKSSKTKNKVSNCMKKESILKMQLTSVPNPRSVLKSSVNRVSSQLKVIPVIDLTNDSAPVLVDKGGKSCPKSKYSKSPNWIFQCYGCGFKHMYKEEFIANSCATKHMKDFHCVSDPKSFIEVVRTDSDIRLEAFPGYKRSLVGGCA